ncbi:MAG: PLP-dependent aminotransferase family protein [bacterium]|nr:PLP-dependent aminotransferase family protein [bacterium]
MTIWEQGPLPRKGPLYIAIADALERDIDAGRVHAGDRLPTHRQLAARLGVNVMTVTRGYAEAARRGLVEGEVGRGTFVRTTDRADVAFVPPQGGNGRPLIDFHFNVPAGDPEQLDFEAALAELAREPQRAGLFDGYSAFGHERHRAVGARWISRTGLEVPADRVLVVGGAQHAMTLALSTLTSPGDPILCEALTYPGLKSLASVLHLRPHPVEIDAHGLVPESLEAAAKKHDARVVYCMPTVQNPTGVVMPQERRAAIAQVAREHELTLVEDDTYGFLCESAPAPLASHCPERTYFLTSTSKNIASGLRIGFLVAPDTRAPVVERLAANVAATTWMAAPLMAELACRWIENGAADKMAAQKRAEGAARRELFMRSLELKHLPGAPTCTHVWYRLPEPWRPGDFTRLARSRGVALTPADAFVVGRDPVPNSVRVCLGTPPSREEAARGVRVLAGLTSSTPELAQAFV